MSTPPDVSIAEVRRAIAAGELSAVDLAQGYLDRIAAHGEALNVYRTVTADLALEQAAAVDEAARRGDPLGPLAGVPVALKDNIAVAGVPMTAGTRHLPAADRAPAQDAPAYEGLRRAGAVLLGKLHMSEWAIGGTNQNVHWGDVHNPWDPARVSGGSSGGSGAAISSDLALATLGTDTGGSIRLPAALSGCCGLRPTSGRVSNRGSIPVAWTFDTIGPLARRAEDVAAMLDAISGYDPDDPVTIDVAVDDSAAALAGGVDGMRIGVLRGWWEDDADFDPAFAALLDEAVGQLERLGAIVEDVELPGGKEALELSAEMLLCEAAWFHQDRLRDTPEVFAPDVLQRLRRGAAMPGPKYGYGRQVQREWRRRVLQVLEGRDLLLCPGAGRAAPLAAESEPLAMTGVLARFIGMWVCSRTPALVVPCGFVDGLPVAMQLLGRPFEDGTVLRAAHGYQQATDWHLRRPDEAAWAGVAR
ncbi:amidase [Capillimicrobium parvum]|uniref:Glutamyl-tRNA(Gln) amidotransferase subunit A n=1 Tax=Capillimicrobium parvum TaxID=2884022 RepID=A0A9E7C334_9ACTN|nr:amidase [Capillimicrobium parvum]UGS39135.1 Glutamyl-tRNA(Gln) amidotransferase subunit A [Capillimicrobium parvum]